MEAPKSNKPMSKKPALTPREWDVLRGIAEGKTNAQIGNGLGGSYETVKMYVNRLRTKLGVRTKVGIAAHAIRHKLVDVT